MQRMYAARRRRCAALPPGEHSSCAMLSIWPMQIFSITSHVVSSFMPQLKQCAAVCGNHYDSAMIGPRMHALHCLRMQYCQPRIATQHNISPHHPFGVHLVNTTLPMYVAKIKLLAHAHDDLIDCHPIIAMSTYVTLPGKILNTHTSTTSIVDFLPKRNVITHLLNLLLPGAVPGGVVGGLPYSPCYYIAQIATPVMSLFSRGDSESESNICEILRQPHACKQSIYDIVFGLLQNCCGSAMSYHITSAAVMHFIIISQFRHKPSSDMQYIYICTHACGFDLLGRVCLALRN